jgi:organic radical activating enzyme
MFGQNPIRPPEKGDGSTLLVQEIFPTIQGEGPLAGVPAVFLRLGGCNLACSFCDTEFESFSERTLTDVVQEVLALAQMRKLVVITGGEPLRQPIELLCEALIAEGFMVQIETNGTLWRKLPEAVRVVVSPKNTGIGYQPLRPDLAARAEGIKFIISASDPLYNNIAPITPHATPIYVQPMDEGDATKNAANLKRCLEISQQTGARLSLQLHKIMGIP